MEEYLGIQILIELNECNPYKLNDIAFIRKIMKQAARRIGATVITSSFRYFKPQGVSGLVVIAESHLSIHTWPEFAYAAVDIFTCGQWVSPLMAFDYLRSELESKSAWTQEIKRGNMKNERSPIKINAERNVS
jgi:S-adenosylmethionine decarboxylase proenzyme